MGVALSVQWLVRTLFSGYWPYRRVRQRRLDVWLAVLREPILRVSILVLVDSLILS